MIRKAGAAELEDASALAAQLWSGHTAAALRAELAVLLERPDAAVFVLYEQGEAAGFAQCQLRRDYVEGTATSPVGYLEGIFVRPEQRGRGYAGQLLAACEDWAREQGCTEFASDCELTNEPSARFHAAMGFQEVNRVICFTKKL